MFKMSKLSVLVLKYIKYVLYINAKGFNKSKKNYKSEK